MTCFSKKKEQKPNDERNFLQKKYWAFSPKMIGIQFFLSFVFFILNIIALTQMKSNSFDEDGNDYAKSKQLIDVITGSDQYGILRNYDCIKCRELGDYFKDKYVPKVKDIVKSQDSLKDFSANKQIIILYSTIFSIFVLVFVFIKTKPILEKIYLQFYQLICINLNVDLYLLHAIKYSTVFDNCCKKYKFWILFIKKLFVEFIFVLYSIIFIYQIIKGCSSGDADDESNKLIDLVESAVKENSTTEDSLIRVKNMTFSIKFIRDTFASCSGSSFFSYMFSDFWQAYSMAQFIYQIIHAFYEVISKICFRKTTISHYRLDDRTKMLIDVPNEQPHETIPLYSGVGKQQQEKQKSQIITFEQQPLQKTLQNLGQQSTITQIQTVQTLNHLPSGDQNMLKNTQTQLYNQSVQSMAPVVFQGPQGQMVQGYYQNPQGVVMPQGQQGYQVVYYNPQMQNMQPVYYSQPPVNYYGSQVQQNPHSQSQH